MRKLLHSILITTNIMFGVAQSICAAPLSDVVAMEEVHLDTFLAAFSTTQNISTKLPSKTILQLRDSSKRKIQERSETSLRNYKLGALFGIEKFSVERFVETFDGRKPVEIPESKPKINKPAFADQLMPLLAEIPATTKPTPSKKARKVKGTNITIGFSSPEPKQMESAGHANQSTQPLANKALLKITVTDRENVTFSPPVLNLDHTTSSARVQILSAAGKSMSLDAETSLFVRNEEVLVFDNKSMRLLTQAEGETEVYFVLKGKVHILPTFVKQNTTAPDLEVPSELIALSDVNHNTPAKYPAKLAEPAAALQQPPQSNLLDTTPEVVDSAVMDDFVVQSRPAKYVTARLKVVDNRSSRDGNDVFPLSRIRVSIAGLPYIGLTDRLGSHQIDNLPSHSRLILKFDDPLGRVRSTVKEIETGDGSAPLDVRIDMPLNRVLSTFEQVAKVVPDMNFATVCGTVVNNRSELLPVAGVSVTLDVSAAGPFYFNRFGYLDPTQGITGDDGRFCFFNVETGPMVASFFQEGKFLSSQVANAHAGRFQDYELYVADPVETAAHLAAQVTAHEQLGSDRQLARSHKAIDMIDVLPLGTGQSMTYLDEGLVGVVGGADLIGGRTFALSQASEFEPVLYSLEGGRNNVLPLLPRGFVDDMAIYAQVPYHPDLGVVVVEHSDLAGQGQQPVEMRLENLAGEQVGEGWYYDNKPTTKVIFFNLPPGQYILNVETEDGYWLASDTVVVFNETVSYIRTGSPLRRRI